MGTLLCCLLLASSALQTFLQKTTSGAQGVSIGSLAGNHAFSGALKRILGYLSHSHCVYPLLLWFVSFCTSSIDQTFRAVFAISISSIWRTTLFPVETTQMTNTVSYLSGTAGFPKSVPFIFLILLFRFLHCPLPAVLLQISPQFLKLRPHFPVHRLI